MEATQVISNSILESDEEENEETDENKRGRPLAKLCILKNGHIPETELPLFLGDNVLGRDTNICTLSLPAPSISKQHATISITAHRRRRQGEVDIEALLWDLGSMNGTYKGLLKLTPNVRYALSEGDRLRVADIPCQYVTCAADTVSSQGDTGTPVSRNSVKANLPDASGGDASTDGKKCVNGGTKARVSLPDVKDAKKTPVRGSWLFSEQTPTPPQTTLVPESDSDSDGERGGRGERKHTAHVSESDSYKSSPTCSTFLSPSNKIVPESPITPSSTGNKPLRHVSFSTEDTDTDVGRQQLKDKQAFEIVDDSEDEEGREEERAALGGGMSDESGQHVPAKEDNNVSLTGEDKFPVSKPAVLTDPIPTFNMDSDTDVEGEEEAVASANAVTLNTNQQADELPNTAQFQMDSDTDVDEEDVTLDKVAKSVPPFADDTNSPPVAPVIQPQGITMDSDTDVDDDDAAASDAASKTVPVSFQSTHTAESASSIQLEDFHLDSDTDVDEEEESERGTVGVCSKVDSTPSRLHIKPVVPESNSAAPHNLHLESDTNEEAILAPTTGEPAVASTVPESLTTADRRAGLAPLSDSDTDMEEDSPVVIPLVVTALSVAAGAIPEALPSEDECSMPPAGDAVDHFGAAADAGVKDEEADIGGADEDQSSSLKRENTKSILAPLSQNCSTPLRSSVPERDMEDVDTQVFQSPSSIPYRRAVAHAVMPSSCSDSLEDEDVIIAETQPFILYGEDEDPARSSLTDDDDRQDTAETQPFLTSSALAMSETQPMSAFDEERQQKPDSSVLQAKPILQNETEERKEDGQAPQPQESFLSEALFVAETQRMYTSDDEETDDEDLIPGPRKRKAKPLQLDDEQTQTLSCSESALVDTQPVHIIDQTQPMVISVNEECDVEASVPGPRKNKGKQLWLEDEETQMLTSSVLPAVQTQLLDAGEHGESDDEDSFPGPRRAKAKALPIQYEETQELTNSEASPVETETLESKTEQSEAGTSGITVRGETLEKEKKEEDENERLQADKAERSRPDQDRAERERQRKEEEEKQRAERMQREKEEQLQKERKEREEGERLERERAEREETERRRREEKAKMDKERAEQEEKHRLETAKRELQERLESEMKDQEQRARLKQEAKEREEREKLAKEKEAQEEQIKRQQEAKEEINKPKTPARSRRATRRTTAAMYSTEAEQESVMLINDDVPARRTRSRSNSSNSVSSERSSVGTMESRGRGRGRRAQRGSNPPRKSTAAAGPTDEGSNAPSPQGVLSRSNSSNSLNSEVSSCSLSSQSRGRGARQRGRGRKTKADSVLPTSSLSDQNSAPRATTSGSWSSKADESFEAPSADNKVKAEPRQARTTRGRQRADANVSATAAEKEVPSNLEEGCATEELLPTKRNVRGRGQKATKTESAEAPVTPAVNDGDETKEKRKRRKGELEANAEEESSSSSKISKRKEKAQPAAAAVEEEAKTDRKDDTPVRATRRGRQTRTQVKAEVKEVMVADVGRVRGRTSMVQCKKEEEHEEGGPSFDQDAQMEATEPQTPSRRLSRKRNAPALFTPEAKTPRSSSASPAAVARSRAASQPYKVLFTGLVDEAGERVLVRLGGSMAKGVADMNILVTDKVRRTVKFLCAVAKGVPIVTTDWLEKSGKAGSFLSPNSFVVKDQEQERKFEFCLQESLRIASSQLFLQGYEIHVTPSVKPEPAQMKDIITCSGATFLAKMPSSHKLHTVVVSCEEDWLLCGPALAASLPVVTAEFLLTGILQQRVDLQTHSLSAPVHDLQPPGGRSRSRKKT